MMKIHPTFILFLIRLCSFVRDEQESCESVWLVRSSSLTGGL